MDQHGVFEMRRLHLYGGDRKPVPPRYRIHLRGSELSAGYAPDQLHEADLRSSFFRLDLYFEIAVRRRFQYGEVINLRVKLHYLCEDDGRNKRKTNAEDQAAQKGLRTGSEEQVDTRVRMIRHYHAQISGRIRYGESWIDPTRLQIGCLRIPVGNRKAHPVYLS